MLFELNREIVDFVNSLYRAGHLLEQDNLREALESSTVDELIERLGSGLDSAGKKYVLGYFGGSGSISLTFDSK